MAGNLAREFSAPLVHQHTIKVDHTNSGVVTIGDLPPCLVTAVRFNKTADWNSGTSATISVGVQYQDGTATDATLLASTADLTSSTSLGPVDIDRDLGGFRLTQNTTAIATLTYSGATSAGEGYATLEYVPATHIVDRT